MGNQSIGPNDQAGQNEDPQAPEAADWLESGRAMDRHGFCEGTSGGGGGLTGTLQGTSASGLQGLCFGRSYLLGLLCLVLLC